MAVYFFVFIITISTIHGEPLEFPKDFKFGVATSSYQIEGAWNENGKGENIWDRLVHEHPDWIVDESNGDIACDSYHKIDEDIKNLKWLGVDFYRFSLSWSRILPSGYTNLINTHGLRYYNQVINALLAQSITPMITLYHWDLPQPLQEIGGWPNEILAEYYLEYVRLAFSEFGDRVKYWITFNEPREICQSGYADGIKAPAENADGIGEYLCGRTVLLAHAKAYRMYQKDFRKAQQGKIGITVKGVWSEPATNTTTDKEAAERSLQMTFGWFCHPIYSKSGDYPKIMKQRVAQISRRSGFPKSRLIPFSTREVKFIQGTYDFFGLNHYSTILVSADTVAIKWKTPSFVEDIGVHSYSNPDWPQTASSGIQIVPWGFRKILNWIKVEYGNPPVYITENGYPDKGAIEDNGRINYHKLYLKAMLQAIQLDGCDVRAYTVWSLMDNFGWRDGFSLRFGLFYVGINSLNRTRVKKDSATFYKKLISDKKIDKLL